MGKSSYTVYSCYGRTRHMKSMPCKECNFRISVCTVLHLFYTLQFAVFIYRFAPVLHTSVRCIYIPLCTCFSHFSSLYLYTVLRLFYTLQFAVFIYRFAPVFHTSVRCIYIPLCTCFSHFRSLYLLYSRTGHWWQYKTAHAHCLLNN